MSISIILAHPDANSFNHAIARKAAETLSNSGLEVKFHDLYAERFPALIPTAEIPKKAVLPRTIARHCREIQEAEGIIIVHPNWWGQPPAALKGWIDRVLRAGTAYEFIGDDKGEGVPVGLLKARTAVVFNTCNTPEEREKAVFGDPLETIWKNCIFGLCGVKDFHRRTFGVIITSTLEQRKQWLEEVRDMVEKCFGKGNDF